MTTTLFRTETTEKAKIEQLRSCATGAAHSEILEALEEHALTFARTHKYTAKPDQGEIGKDIFTSPVKGKKLCFTGDDGEEAVPYDPDYDDLKRLCIAKVLGEAGLPILQSRIESLTMTDTTSFVSHKRHSSQPNK